LQPGSNWDPNLNVFGQIWENIGFCLGLLNESRFPKLLLRGQLFATRFQLGSQLECLWAGLGKFGHLLGPVQLECVSGAFLEEATFCNQVPDGIPIECLWAGLGKFKLLLGPVQLECVSRAPLQDAHFCSQAPLGIPS